MSARLITVTDLIIIPTPTVLHTTTTVQAAPCILNLAVIAIARVIAKNKSDLGIVWRLSQPVRRQVARFVRPAVAIEENKFIMNPFRIRAPPSSQNNKKNGECRDADGVEEGSLALTQPDFGFSSSML